MVAATLADGEKGKGLRCSTEGPLTHDVSLVALDIPIYPGGYISVVGSGAEKSRTDEPCMVTNEHVKIAETLPLESRSDRKPNFVHTNTDPTNSSEPSELPGVGNEELRPGSPNTKTLRTILTGDGKYPRSVSKKGNMETMVPSPLAWVEEPFPRSGDMADVVAKTIKNEPCGEAKFSACTRDTCPLGSNDANHPKLARSHEKHRWYEKSNEKESRPTILNRDPSVLVHKPPKKSGGRYPDSYSSSTRVNRFEVLVVISSALEDASRESKSTEKMDNGVPLPREISEKKDSDSLKTPVGSKVETGENYGRH